MSLLVPPDEQVRSRPGMAGTPLLLALVLIAGSWVWQEPLTHSVRAVSEDLPATVATRIDLAADVGLMSLVALALWCGVRARHHTSLAVATALAAGMGSAAAYLVSEGVKVLVAQERPCQSSQDWALTPCPPIGDYSWPSNHATIAGALATAVVMMAPWLSGWATGLAATVALARLVALVHFPHDVMAGLLLGTVTVAVAVRVTAPALASRIDRIDVTSLLGRVLSPPPRN